MRIVEINAVNRGSTGTIMRGVANLARTKGHEVLVCYPNSRENKAHYQEGDYLVGTVFSRNIGRWISIHYKSEHCIHLLATFHLIQKLKQFNPDVIHIHNIHDSFLNLPLLFNYIRRSSVRVIWTMHDCWLMTGHCGFYVDMGCSKWQQGCKDCQHYDVYPHSKYNDAVYKINLKRELLSPLIKRLILTPVSTWLAHELSKSYLKDFRYKIIANGVNIDVFRPIIDDSIRSRYGIPEGRIILAAGTAWGRIKGLYDFYKLSYLLQDNEHIVLIGVSDEVLNEMPPSIIGIRRTDNAVELAKLYSTADVVLSLSYRETFGMTIIEANACGTPVIVYDNTAQPELVSEDNGLVVPSGNIKALLKAIKTVFAIDRDKWRNSCRGKVINGYSEAISYQKYIDLFNDPFK